MLDGILKHNVHTIFRGLTFLSGSEPQSLNLAVLHVTNRPAIRIAVDLL